MSRLGLLRPDRAALSVAGTAAGIVRITATECREVALIIADDLRPHVGRAVLGAVDFLLAAATTQEALRRIVASDIAREAVAEAVRGPVVEVLLADGVAEQIALRVVEGPELAQILDVTLASESMQRTIAGALDSPGVERIVGEAVEGKLIDQVVRALLQSEELWVLVTEVAESPQVTAALSRQTAGVADQITDEVRERSRDADDWVERTAHRMLRRRNRTGQPPRPALPPSAEPPEGVA
ncbi:MAG: hypothetical protein JHC95_09275 [Solirubrobacteraceae bacterium]|nr:hypothetical protein [Solirubrobacteraceae bacterium]